MKLYVVCHGERGEGLSPNAIFDTLDAAREYALALEPVFPGGWKQKDENLWENGCDLTMIQEFTLNAKP